MATKLRKDNGTFIDADSIAVESTAVANAGALTSAQLTGGESPTEAEYNALQTDVAAIHTKLNALLAALRTGNTIAT